MRRSRRRRSGATSTTTCPHLVRGLPGEPASRRRRAGDRVHDPEHHRAARADPGADQDVDSGGRGLPARSRRRPNGVPALEHQLDPLLAADQHRAGVPGLADGDAVPRALSQQRRDGRVRRLRLARLRERVEGDPAVGVDHRRTRPGDEPPLLQPLPARRGSACRRLAGRDLRPRLRRQQELEPVPGRLVAGTAWDRDDRDQRRRPRRRRARDADRQPHRRLARRPSRRRPRHQPGREPGDRLDRGRQRPSAVHADLEPRRPPPDGRRPDAARARDRGRDGRRRRRRPRPRPGADLVRGPVVRRHLRDEVPRGRAERRARRAERARRRDRRDRAAEPRVPRARDAEPAHAGRRR